MAARAGGVSLAGALGRGSAFVPGGAHLTLKRLTLIAVAVFAMVSPALAQGSGSTKPPSGSKERPHAVTRLAEGTVVEIDRSSGVIVLETGDGRLSLSIDNDTKFSGRADASFANLAEGERIRARYRTSGNVAIQIRVSS